MDALTGISSATQGIDLSFDTSARQGGTAVPVNRIKPTSRRERNEFDEDLRIGQQENNEDAVLRGSPREAEASPGKDTDATGLRLSPEKQEEVEELKRRDQEVRTHEQAHIAASGGVSVSGPSYSLTKGPDGQMYAVAGEVQIDTSEGKTPEETITKARQIRAAANAPAQPSGQDKAVAAQAGQMEADARKEMAEERRTEQEGGGKATSTGRPSEVGSTAQATAVAGSQAVAQSRETAGTATATSSPSSPSTRERARGYAAYGQEASRLVPDRFAIQGQNAATRAMEGLGNLSRAVAGQTEGLSSGYLNGTNRAQNTGPEAMRRAAKAYESAKPETGLAPAGTGISRAV